MIHRHFLFMILFSFFMHTSVNAMSCQGVASGDVLDKIQSKIKELREKHKTPGVSVSFAIQSQALSEPRRFSFVSGVRSQPGRTCGLISSLLRMENTLPLLNFY